MTIESDLLMSSPSEMLCTRKWTFCTSGLSYQLTRQADVINVLNADLNRIIRMAGIETLVTAIVGYPFAMASSLCRQWDCAM